MRGPHVFSGYFKNAEATAETMTEDGWLRSGDLGSIDEDGYLHITGRKKDLIITVQRQEHQRREPGERPARHSLGLSGGGPRRRPPLPGRIDHARPGEVPALAARVGVEPDPETMSADPRVHAELAAEVERAERAFRAHRADQALHDPHPRPDSGARRAHADVEGQAGRGESRVRGRARRALRPAIWKRLHSLLRRARASSQGRSVPGRHRHSPRASRCRSTRSKGVRTAPKSSAHDAAAEDPVGPALIEQHDGQEGHGRPQSSTDSV